MPFSLASLIPPWAVVIPALLCFIGWIEDQPLLLLVGQIQLFAYVTFIRHVIPFLQTWLRARTRAVGRSQLRHSRALDTSVKDIDATSGNGFSGAKDGVTRDHPRVELQPAPSIQSRNRSIREWSSSIPAGDDLKSVCSESTATEEIKSSSSQHFVSFSDLGSQYRVTPPKLSRSKSPRVSVVAPASSWSSVPGPVKRTKGRPKRLSRVPTVDSSSVSSLVSTTSVDAVDMNAESGVTGSVVSDDDDDDGASDITERSPDGDLAGWGESSGQLLAYGTT